MVERAIEFDNAAGYEQFMGRWSRAAGITFLQWLEPPSNARWLDVGCGTGVFTGLVVETPRPVARSWHAAI